MARKQSRGDRWQSAVAEAREALDAFDGVRMEVTDDIQTVLDEAESKMQDARDALDEAYQHIRDVQEEYQEWYDNMPEGLQDGATGEKLQMITEIDLELDMDALALPEVEIEIDLSEIEQQLDEAENVRPPTGIRKGLRWQCNGEASSSAWRMTNGCKGIRAICPSTGATESSSSTRGWQRRRT